MTAKSKLILSIAEAAELLGVHEDTITRYIKIGKASTLATKATRSGGPPFAKFGQRVLHRWDDALAWPRERLTPTGCSPSEQNRAAQ